MFTASDTFILFLYFFLFRAAPATYGSSQARDRIGAAAASLHHSHTGSKPYLRPTPQLTLSETREQTCILMDTSQVLNPLSHNGNSNTFKYKYSRVLYLTHTPVISTHEQIHLHQVFFFFFFFWLSLSRHPHLSLREISKQRILIKQSSLELFLQYVTYFCV